MAAGLPIELRQCHCLPNVNKLTFRPAERIATIPDGSAVRLNLIEIK
jgi:hypothetical protein